MFSIVDSVKPSVVVMFSIVDSAKPLVVVMFSIVDSAKLSVDITNNPIIDICPKIIVTFPKNMMMSNQVTEPTKPVVKPVETQHFTLRQAQFPPRSLSLLKRHSVKRHFDKLSDLSDLFSNPFNQKLILSQFIFLL